MALAWATKGEKCDEEELIEDVEHEEVEEADH